MSDQTLSRSTAEVITRGRESYAPCFDAMREFTDRRDSATPDQIWLVEHPPIYTLGLGADPANILDAGDIPVVQTDRGGEVTYHGPGQAIAYLLFDLRRERSNGKLLPREFVHRIEQAVIDTLAAYNLQGERRAGAPGIYLVNGEWKGAKIAALGLKIRGNGCMYHGVALNVDMNLEPFSRIHPCGYQGLRTIDMKTLGVKAGIDEVQAMLAQQLVQQLGS